MTDNQFNEIKTYLRIISVFLAVTLIMLGFISGKAMAQNTSYGVHTMTNTTTGSYSARLGLDTTTKYEYDTVKVIMLISDTTHLEVRYFIDERTVYWIIGYEVFIREFINDNYYHWYSPWKHYKYLNKWKKELDGIVVWQTINYK